MNTYLKKLIAIMMIMALGLAACTSAEPTPTAVPPTEEPMEEPMEEPTEEPMEEPMEEPTEEPMEEPTEEPEDVMEELGTVGDIAMADDQFSILVDAVLATGLDTTLQGPGPITVFAPTNDAFAKLPEGTLDSLTTEQLTDILLYHVVEGSVMSDAVMGMDMGTSALGEDFTVTVDGDTVMINDATIIMADIEASNGVIHVIDTVLMPPSMMMAEEEMMDEEMDDEMMDEGMMMPSVIYATSNPADLENDAIYGLTPDLMDTMLTFNGFAEGITSVESIAFAADGTAYLTVDTGDGSGSLVGVPDLGNMSDSMMLTDGEMMMTEGLTAPKGLQVVDELGLVIVADFGANAIVVFDRDLNMMGSVDNLGGDRSIWDVHHDVDSDTLYATGTDGVLLAYEGFSSAMGVDGPTRMIIPADADGNQISVNLHGISYYAANDELILTDVGDAGSAEDGQLFVITDGSTADGNTTVSVQIGGPESMLGNPVDVVYDGAYAYVAEKSNDAVLRFDDLLSMDMMGMMGDAAPALMIEVLKAESVALPADSMMSEGMMDG